MSLSKQIFARTLRNFFEPIESLLSDESISEILVNAHDEVYVERFGVLERVDARFPRQSDFWAALYNLAQSLGTTLDSGPFLEGRLPDGARVQAILPPVAPRGPCIAIRLARSQKFSLESFADPHADGDGLLALLQDIVSQRRNALVSGESASGKTSLLDALTAAVGSNERVIAVEHTGALTSELGHVIRLESRDVRSTPSEILRKTLKMRPDRVVVGELMGGEAFELLRAMTSGCSGCLATVDAACVEDALSMFEHLAAAGADSGSRLRLESRIAGAIDAIIHVARFSNGRRWVVRISEVVGWTRDSGYEMRELYGRA